MPSQRILNRFKPVCLINHRYQGKSFARDQKTGCEFSIEFFDSSRVVIAKTNEATYKKSIHLTSSDIGTYFYQSRLPKQPIPSLIHTGEKLKKYLKALKSHPNFSAYDIDRLTVLWEQFIENEGFESTLFRR